VSFVDVGDHLAIALDGGTALFTTRRGGVSEGPFASLNLGLWTDDDGDLVRENRARVERLGGGRLAQVHQVHGTAVIEARPGNGGPPPDADGQVTAQRGVAPMALAADCLPVALIAPEGVAMLHAGWRGLAAGILAAGADTLRGLGASRIAAAIGPGIGPCCYEVGEEVAQPFAARFGADVLRGRRLDLWTAAERALREAGVTRIERVDLCSACNPELFFSHRRDEGLTGRQGVVALVA
jgi:YfiH family protein